MTIEDWRDQIDALDRKLLDLITERARCVLAVGRLKNQQNREIFDPERERQIIQKIIQENKGPLDEGALRRIFQGIIDECRRIENQ